MSQAQPPSGPVRALPIWDTVTATYGSVFAEHPADLPRAIAFPMALSVFLGLLQVWMAPEIMMPDPEAPPESFSGAAIFIGLLGVAPYTLFCVAWQRTVLLNEQAPWVMPWRARHWRFLIYSIALGLIGVGLSLIVFLPIALLFSGEQQGGIAAILFFVGFLVLMTVGLRLSFVLPAIAVDERYGLLDAWRHSRRQGLRLLGAALLFYIPLLIASLIALLVISLVGAPLLILSAGDSGEAPSLIVILFWLLVSNILSYVVMALALSFIAIAFRTCSGWVPGPPATPLTAGPFEGGGNGET